MPITDIIFESNNKNYVELKTKIDNDESTFSKNETELKLESVKSLGGSIEGGYIKISAKY